ncbi:hypothetical protein ALC53_13909 [Atta colombica]|uniref:Uncharacterized protein n=1 Tax=Atta colombica TaxID=520822 RepID=A0A195AV44_9HYME|nr:hypothetical protein ALC53_13909 [Atta colombica]
MDGLSADLVAIGIARQVILEERFARLEGEVRARPATSTGSSIINERDHELIVFGLPKVLSENYTETITRVSSLDVLVSSSKIVFRISGRNSSLS